MPAPENGPEPLSERDVKRRTVAAGLIAAAMAWSLLAGYFRNKTGGWDPNVLTSLLPSLGLLAAGILVGRGNTPAPPSSTDENPTQTTHRERQPQ